MESAIARPFWLSLSRYDAAPALIDAQAQTVVSYRDLARQVEQIAEGLRCGPKRLVLIPLDNRLEDIVRYLGCLASGHAVCIYNQHAADESLSGFIRRYRPDLTFGRASALCEKAGMTVQDGMAATGFTAWRSPASDALHPSLALVLSTSGTTGPGRLVRHSDVALAASAEQVVLALGISPRAVAMTSLPLSYIFGLTVLHSHLAAGASVVITARSVLEKQFWQAVTACRATSFSGVPWTYQMLRSAGVDAKGFPHLTDFHTSGGRLAKPLKAWLGQSFLSDRARIFYMYGQTEACGRISVLSPEMLAAKPGSVGRAVQGGSAFISPGGVLRYAGPNVMMGYADSREDLCRGYALEGPLDTGDFGSIDSDGFIYLSGRKSRVAKVYGLRVNLDEAQAWLNDADLEAIVLGSGEERLLLRCGTGSVAGLRKAAAGFARHLGVPVAALAIEEAPDLSRLPSGKLKLGTQAPTEMA